METSLRTILSTLASGCRRVLPVLPSTQSTQVQTISLVACITTAGETAMALRYLTAARDFDVCPLRATTPIVQAVIDSRQ